MGACHLSLTATRRRAGRGLLALAALIAGAAAPCVRAQDHAPATAAPPANAAADAPQYWFGVAVENIPPSFAKQLKLQPQQGLIVVGVVPSTPAEKAGLRADDLLIEVNRDALLSQEQLARAANTLSPGKTVAAAMQPCDLTYMREGNKLSVRLAPQLRPTNMAVTGANLENFSAGATLQGAARAPDMRNYVLSNGKGVQVGPGYTFDLSNDGASESVIRAAVQNGQTVVMSQEKDASGNLTNTISANGATYAITGDLHDIPASLQPLAQQIQANAARQRTANAPAQMQTPANPRISSIGIEDKQLNQQQQMIEQLLKQNQKLQEQIDQLTKTINDRLGPPPAR